MELDVHFIREQVVAKHLKVQFVPSECQVAIVLTKPLSLNRFYVLRSEALTFIKGKRSEKMCAARRKGRRESSEK